METTPVAADNTPEQINGEESSRAETENRADGQSIFTDDVAQRVISTDESIQPQVAAGTTDENEQPTENQAPSGEMINNTGSDKGTGQADADAASG